MRSDGRSPSSLAASLSAPSEMRYLGGQGGSGEVAEGALTRPGPRAAADARPCRVSAGGAQRGEPDPAETSVQPAGKTAERRFLELLGFSAGPRPPRPHPGGPLRPEWWGRSPRPDPSPGYVRVPVAASDVQRRPAGLVPLVDVSPVLDQQLHALQVPGEHSLVQGGQACAGQEGSWRSLPRTPHRPRAGPTGTHLRGGWCPGQPSEPG